jgi:hypothetical protein
MRLKYIQKVISNPKQHPLSHYYLGPKITPNTNSNNRTSRHHHTPHLFYKSCIQSLKGNDSLINTKPENIYKKMVENLAPNLCERIKSARQLRVTQFKATFHNLHIKGLSPKVQELTCRLIFGMLPLEGTKKDCPLCKSIEETEEPIFLKCCFTRPH